MSDTENAQELARVRELLSRLSRANEDEKTTFAAPLRAFEAEHSTAVLQGKLSDSVTEVYGLVAIELGLLDKANEAFSILIDRAHLKLQNFRLTLATIYRKQKRPRDAQELLESIEGKTRNRKLYGNEVERVRKALVSRQWQHDLLRARASFLAGDVSTALAAIRMAYAGIGLNECQIHAIVPVLEAAMALYLGSAEIGQTGNDPQPVSPPPTLSAGVKLLSLSGFGWSGSGAVADFVRGRHGVAFPFGGTELCCFEGFEKCALGADSVLAAMRGGDPLQVQCAAAMLVLSGFLMAIPAQDGVSAAEMDRWRRKVGLTHVLNHHTTLDGLASCLLAFTTDMRNLTHGTAAPDGCSQAITALQRLFSSFMALVAGEGRVLVLNNCIHAYNIGLLRLLPDALGVVVHRDPRDAFVARQYENTRTASKSPVSFIKNLQKHYEAYRRQRAHGGGARQVIDIGFEDFLHDAALRTTVLERLGLDAAKGDTGALRLDVSRRNIGIHAGYPNQGAISAIAATDFRFTA
jgi:hypothetical protein